MPARRAIRNGWVAAVSTVAAMIAIGATLTVASLVGFVIVLTWYRSQRSERMAAWLVRRAHKRAIRAGRAQREHALARAGVRDNDLADLTALVDEIAKHDPDAVERYDLESLLDRYTEFEVARTRTRIMLQRFDRGVLARQLAAIPPGAKRTRCDLLRRRLEHLDACRERASALDDDIDEIRELLCLLAQRTSVGDDGDVDEAIRLEDAAEIERRVMLLEGFDGLSLVAKDAA